jgi:hypothetical protein
VEATCFSETSVHFQRTTLRYIAEGGTVHNHRCVNFKSYIAPCFVPLPVMILNLLVLAPLRSPMSALFTRHLVEVHIPIYSARAVNHSYVACGSRICKFIHKINIFLIVSPIFCGVSEMFFFFFLRFYVLVPFHSYDISVK